MLPPPATYAKTLNPNNKLLGQREGFAWHQIRMFDLCLPQLEKTQNYQSDAISVLGFEGFGCDENP
eukprot:scaffold435701_cov13-Prasinocladus_malaysianus.AAC.1